MVEETVEPPLKIRGQALYLLDRTISNYFGIRYVRGTPVVQSLF